MVGASLDHEHTGLYGLGAERIQGLLASLITAQPREKGPTEAGRFLDGSLPGSVEAIVWCCAAVPRFDPTTEYCNLGAAGSLAVHHILLRFFRKERAQGGTKT
jgi:hypothetical protein